MRDDKGADATVFVGIVDGGLVAVVIALLVCDEGFELRAPAVVSPREEPKEMIGKT